MSGVFKAIGKVFKSVVKAVGKVVKGVVKVIKKVAPVALMAAAVYFGGAALAGSFSSAGAGMAAGGAGVTGSGLAGAAGAIHTTAGAAGTLGAAASATGSVFSSSLLSNPVFSAVNGLTTGAAKGVSSVLGAVKGVGGFIASNPELTKVGMGMIQGMNESKAAEEKLDYMREADDKALAQRQAEDQWNGGVMGVDREGNSAGSQNAMTYTPTQTSGEVDDENARMDALFAQSQDSSGLLELYNQAHYKQNA